MPPRRKTRTHRTTNAHNTNWFQADKQYLAQALTATAQQLFAATNRRFDQLQNDIQTQLADVRRLLMESKLGPNPVGLVTDHAVAVKSNDHLHPWGTKNDNTRGGRFCRACESHFKRPLRALDLGCSGGGIVLDFLLRAHYAMGPKGSDFSLRNQRAERQTIGDCLSACDVTKLFQPTRRAGGELENFDVISIWEVLEHIAEADPPQLFANVKQHLASDGLFVSLIALRPDIVNDVDYHRTVKPSPWWQDVFRRHGLEFVQEPIFSFYDFCRETGNGPLDPDFSKGPSAGFHYIARHTS